MRSAASNARGFHGGCSVRTDSNGVVCLFYTHFEVGTPGVGAHTMQKSLDGGVSWTKPRDILVANDSCYNVDPITGRCVADGGAGARIDLMGSPSVDIANGAPTGSDATNEIVDAWGDGSAGLNNEVTLLSWSTNGGSGGVVYRPLREPGRPCDIVCPGFGRRARLRRHVLEMGHRRVPGERERIRRARLAGS